MKRPRKQGGKSPPKHPPCNHYGQKAVRVGDHVVYPGGTRHFQTGDFNGMNLIIPLTIDKMPFEFGVRYEILAAPMEDYGGVPKYWKAFLDQVIEELRSGKKILPFCVGSHGRTGTFIASLIALLESREETPDPIKAVRERHCTHAVESLAQAEAIFALRGEPLPEKYRKEFRPLPLRRSLQGAPQPTIP